MKFWKYGRVALALMGAVVLGMSITCCGVYTSGYMYVTGAQYNQIGAFKIDHDFGYLTPVTGSPFAAGGSDPVQEAVLQGGRFLAVVNKGSSSVSIYTIGGSGVLYPQATYASSGASPVALATSSTGNYLYVLDKYAPDGSGRGDITVFAIDPNTAKLTLITNSNTFNTNGSQLPYFEVNYNPVQLVTAGASSSNGGGNFVFVLDTAYPAMASSGAPAACLNQPSGSACTIADVFPYSVNANNGQLVLTQNSPLQLGTLPGAASNIYASGAYVWITDTQNNQGGSTGRILPYSVGTGGVLQTLVGGPVPNPSTTPYPDAIITNTNNRFLYMANFGPASSTQPNSNISEFTIDPTTGQLIQNSSNLYPTGSGPVWLAIDPTNQYLYSANNNDNSITASVIQQTTGQLSNLVKGSTTQATVGQPTYIAVTGRTY